MNKKKIERKNEEEAYIHTEINKNCLRGKIIVKHEMAESNIS